MKNKMMWLSLAACSRLMAVEELGSVVVEDDVAKRLEKTGALKDSIVPTEVLDAKMISQKQALNLSEAIDNEPGIQSATGCSMCGMKRTRINGLKGEHTTVLVDNVPMHSTVSSYYGIDSIGTAGVESIEIARGSGASLIAPGAIGGVINIKTKRAERNGVTFDGSAGNDDYANLSGVGTAVSEDGKSRVMVAAQYSNQDQWDADDNGVNESPRMKNQSVRVKFSQDFGSRDNVDLSVAYMSSDVFGGPMSKEKYGSIMGDGTGTVAFRDDDVRKEYTGDPLATLEVIDTDRQEAIAKWTHEMGATSNFVITGSGAKQIQDSIYEGDTYYSTDYTYFLDGRVNYFLGENHFLTGGADTKQENMRSHASFYANPDMSKDNFEFSSYGAYLQDVWTPAEGLEISLALRGDKIDVDWTDIGSGSEIDKFVVVPRLHIRWDHSLNWTSRISAGQGYRAPLTFFESEHGILEDGFGIDVDELERSNSAGYNLAYESARWTANASASWTQVKNLAYINDEDYVRPTLASLHETLNTYTFDIVAGYQMTEWLNLGASYEHYLYDDDYKAAQFLAQIEDRARLLLNIDYAGWAFSATGTWIGARDLSEYGYEGWNRLADIGDASKAKSTDAPAYYTVDMRLSKAINESYTLYGGVKNLTDYTQAGNEDTPLFYDADGGYDVGFIYGPLRGRQFYVGLQGRF